MRLRFLTINIYNHTAVATPILQLRLSKNSKTEIQSEIIEKQIIGMQIDFAIKQVFLLC